MAVQIAFDAAGVPLLPHLILATRSGKKYREIPINEVQFHESLVNGSEFSFSVYKEACLDKDGNIDENFWRTLTDFKLAWCKDFNRWYELKVDMTESTETVKSVMARSLGEAELSQISVYDIQVNTETDIERDDYEPTVLYDATHPSRSLVNRLLYKAPHYRIAHVDDSIASIQRTFEFDGKTIHDCFQEISQEIGCLFQLDCKEADGGGVDRTISVYDLEYHCAVCGQRGEFMPVCTNCGYQTVPGYGTDTSVFVARENLAQEITYTTNTDAVKNCFRLEAGDDLMTASIKACNPNGSQYIWYITDNVKSDMSQELQDRISSYNTLYNYYQNEATYSPPAVLRTRYNNLVNKYHSYRQNLNTMPATLTGWPAVMSEYFNTIDLQLFLDSELMPVVINGPTTAAQEAAKLTSQSLNIVAVANLESCTVDTATSAVVGMAKCLIRGTYQVKATSGSISTLGDYKQWTGRLQVVNYGDESDSAETGTLTVVICSDMEQYIRQKIDRMIAQTEEGAAEITALFKLSFASFANELKKYCRQRLLAFREACQAALDVMIQQGVADEVSWVSEENNLYDNLYAPYLAKMSAIEAEIALRNSEIAIVAGSYDANGGLLTAGMQNELNSYMDTVRAALDFEAYLGTTLMNEFAAYRREDLYKNENYISDGLNNYDLMVNAERFLEAAKKEIYKSAQLQHSIQASMSNLLAMEEFQPLKLKFRVGNWIRVMADGQIYRLRLSEYTIDYTKWTLDVTFTDLREGANAYSDLESLLASMNAMSTSYGAVTRSARDGEKGKDLLDRWVNEGLALTTQIVGGAQNQEFVMDETGFTGKELIPETGEYSPEQIKIISHGIYMTDNGWVTAKAALGRFRMINPQNNFQVEDRFGVIADTLVGNLILSQELGIYNSDGSMTIDENGFILTTEHTDNTKVFTIRRHEADGTYNNIVSLDASGNLVLNNYDTSAEVSAKITVSEGEIKTYVGDNYAEKSDVIAVVDVEYIKWDYDDAQHAPPDDDPGWQTTSPEWEYGKYIWQRTKTTDGDNNVSYSSPVCIQGAAASVYSVVSSETVVVRQEDGTYLPSFIDFMGVKQVGNSSSGSYAGRFVIETTADGSTWTTRYTSASNESSKRYTIPSGITAVRCSLYLAGGTTTLLDQQTVPMVNEGGTGEDAYTVILTNENHTFVGSETAALANQTATCNVIAYKGSTQVAATIGSINGAPTGMTVTRYNNSTTSAYFTVSVGTTMTTKNGTLTVPVTVDGTTFNMVFTYSLALKGDDGLDITSIVEQYYLSTSNSSCTGGTWSYTQQAWIYGRYLWTRSEITWADGSVTHTDPALADAINKANEQAYNTNQNLTQNYSTTQQTKELLATEVHRTTLGAVVSAADTNNRSPYPYTTTSSNSGFNVTSNGDGTYTLVKTSASAELYLSANCSLAAGTYYITLIINDTNATGNAYVQLTIGGSAGSYQSMTKSTSGGRTYYRKTITASSTISKILIDIASGSSYAAVGWIGSLSVMINTGSTYMDFESPAGSRMGIESAYSQIKQTADGLSSKVEKNGVISAINQSSESVTINANKVNISGFLTVSDVSSTGTVEIYGGRIKGGTLTLGGANNGNGQLSIVNASNQALLSANNTSLTYYCRSSTASFLIKNGSGNNLMEANQDGLTVTCRSSGAGLYIVDNNNVQIMAANKDGIVVNRGIIKGPHIWIGGNGNENGILGVYDASGNGVASLSKDGLWVAKGTIQGPTIVAGGNNNTNGQILVQNQYGTTIVTADCDGMRMIASSSSDYLYVSPQGIWASSLINIGTSNSYQSSLSPGDIGTVYGTDHYSYMYGGEVYARDELSTGGSKPRIVDTENFGRRRLCAYETPTPMFGDIGEGVIDTDGKAYIFIDPIFAETVTAGIAYQVFLQKYGQGDCAVTERHEGLFVVEGTPGLRFTWEMKAKQIDYDQWRFEEYEPPKERFTTMMNSDLDEQAADFIEEYYKEIETA